MESDALCGACGGGYSQDAVAVCQSDDRTLRGTDVDTGGSRCDLRWVVDGHRGGHLRVKCQESIAVGGKHLIGDGLALGVVGPVALGEEILACHIAESGSPITFVVGVRAIGGHELGVELVVHAPSVCIVDERVGGLRRSYATYGTGILSATGAAHKGLDKALRIMVKGAGLAIDGVDEGHLADVVHLGNIVVVEIRLAPTLVIAMVTMLEQHAAVVDGLHHLRCYTTGPSTKFGR